jgi:hypothetical protein
MRRVSRTVDPVNTRLHSYHAFHKIFWWYKEKRRIPQYNGDNARTERAVSRAFVVPENSSFDFLYEHRNEVNIGELINMRWLILKANRQN